MLIEVGYLGKRQVFASAKVRRRVAEQRLNLRDNLLDKFGGCIIGLSRCLGKDTLDMLAVGFANKSIDKKSNTRALQSCVSIPRLLSRQS